MKQRGIEKRSRRVSVALRQNLQRVFRGRRSDLAGFRDFLPRNGRLSAGFTGPDNRVRRAGDRDARGRSAKASSHAEEQRQQPGRALQFHL